MSITVKYEDLQKTSSALRAGNDELTTALARMRAVVESLVASGFVTDVASTRFRDSYEQWNTGATNMIQGLQGMSAFLDQAVARHQQLDTELGGAAGAAAGAGAGGGATGGR
jgi:WXG100 family type VII secretion target